MADKQITVAVTGGARTGVLRLVHVNKEYIEMLCPLGGRNGAGCQRTTQRPQSFHRHNAPGRNIHHDGDQRPRRRDADGLMADKQITVAVPEERVPEFYVWFASFLAAEAAAARRWGGGRRGRGRGARTTPSASRPPGRPRTASRPRGSTAGSRRRRARSSTSSSTPRASAARATRSPPGSASTRAPTASPGVLAWPGRYSRKVARELPIATEGRADGGTDYYMEPAVAEIFAAARARRAGRRTQAT